MTYNDLCEILDRKRRQRIAYLRRVAELNVEIKDLYEKKREIEKKAPMNTRHYNYPPIKIKDILKKILK